MGEGESDMLTEFLLMSEILGGSLVEVKKKRLGGGLNMGGVREERMVDEKKFHFLC
ncbi:hypothetical protein [Rubritalea tangerina]|uniref:hypothetical protein n=1 Tax=Rubritalea tangerina TaxID=430798 RepID=UPI003613BEC9